MSAGRTERPHWSNFVWGRNPRRCAATVCLLAMTLCFGLLGCMTSRREYVDNGYKVGPNYAQPAAVISPEWIDYRDERISSVPQIDWAWWRVFHDADLDALVQTAYGQNLTLKEAGFRVMESRAVRAVAAGNMFPQTQDATGSYRRQQLSSQSGLQAGGGGGGGFPGGQSNFDVWATGGQLVWELDFWGRFRRSIEAADAELDASVENYDDVLVILLGDVSAAYVEIRTLEQRLRYARSNVSQQQGSLDIAKAKLEEGRSCQLDVSQAVTNLARTEALVPELEARLRQAQNRLCVLLGLPPHDISRLLAGPNSIPQAPPQVAIGIPAELIRRRPDVRRAEREVAAQSARIGIAESELYPAFQINGNLFVQANQFNNLFRSSALAGNVGPSFNWNILNYGRIRNAVEAERARLMQEIMQYQSVVLRANREAEDALAAYLGAQEQARVLREGVAAAVEARDLTNVLYDAGKVDYGRVFFAEYFLVQQQDELAQAEGAIAGSLVEIYRALGGGWQIRLEPLPGMAFAPAALPPSPPVTVPPAEEIPKPVEEKAAAVEKTSQPAESEVTPTPHEQPIILQETVTDESLSAAQPSAAVIRDATETKAVEKEI